MKLPNETASGDLSEAKKILEFAAEMCEKWGENINEEQKKFISFMVAHAKKYEQWAKE